MVGAVEWYSTSDRTHMAPKLEQIDTYRWRLPKHGAMRVDGLVFADEPMAAALAGDPCLDQVANVAHLPGIQVASLAMPDMHWGYGFPIGGVAAMDADEGVISPGGVGYDINCGVRLLRCDLASSELQEGLTALVEEMFRQIPTGVGAARDDLHLKQRDLRRVLAGGAGWAVRRGMGLEEDLEYLEEGGCLTAADPERVSQRALERGAGSWARSAPAITLQKFRSWIKCSTNRPRVCWVWHERPWR